MVRLGVSLPGLMQLLGHKDIRMTLRYVQVTQSDLQREFHQARLNAALHHRMPQLSRLSGSACTASDLPAIRAALDALRHLAEMYRRQLSDDELRRTAQRLNKRLLHVARDLGRLSTAEK